MGNTNEVLFWYKENTCFYFVWLYILYNSGTMSPNTGSAVKLFAFDTKIDPDYILDNSDSCEEKSAKAFVWYWCIYL